MYTVINACRVMAADTVLASAGLLTLWRPRRHRCVWPEESMQVETKYLRLHTPVALGSRFGDWRVCWLGGWAKHRMFYIVMVVRVKS